MKFFGLIKWFDVEKGFGILLTPESEEIFLHKNSFLQTPPKLLIATALVFEIETSKNRKVAIKVALPSSYEDFEIIMNRFFQSNIVSIEVTVNGKSRWGNAFKKKEQKKFDAVSYSLYQLLSKRGSLEIADFYTNYFQKNYNLFDHENAIKFISDCSEKISRLDLSADENLNKEICSIQEQIKNNLYEAEGGIFINDIKPRPNEILIKKIYIVFFKFISHSLLFQIWKLRIHEYRKSSFALKGRTNEDIYFEFPDNILMQNFSQIGEDEVRRILLIENLKSLAKKILLLKIKSIELGNHQKIEEILIIFQIISIKENCDEFIENIIDITVQYLILLDYKGSKANVSKFQNLIERFARQFGDKNLEQLVSKINIIIPEDQIFILWRETSYFNPEGEFFTKYRKDLRYSEILKAPVSWHQNYVDSYLQVLGHIETDEKFILFCLLIIESPIKVIEQIQERIPNKFRAILWLAFTQRNEGYSKFYQTEYYSLKEFVDEDDFIDLLKSEYDFNYLSSLLNIILTAQKNFSNCQYSYFDKGFIYYSLEERKSYVNDLLKEKLEINKEFGLELFKSLMIRCTESKSIQFAEVIFPHVLKVHNSFNDFKWFIRNLEICESLKVQLFEILPKFISDKEKVLLWLNGYLKVIDIVLPIKEFASIENKDQPKLLRKIFSILHKEFSKAEKIIESLFAVNENSSINLNVKISIAVLKSLYNKKQYVGENIISETVSEYVNEGIDSILQIDDLIEECMGRTWMTNDNEVKVNWFMNVEGKEFPVNDNKVYIGSNSYGFNKDKKTVLIEGEDYNFKWSKKETKYFSKLYDTPRGITFCDAKQSQYDESLKRNFSWCCNAKCFHPCQNDFIHLEWEKYSLRDFIKILHLPFEEDYYYRFVSLINRANRLLKKLQCDTCKKLLKDAKTSEFAFYRVTTFHCTDNICSEFNNPVYLNHCLNWKCLNVVDSRISVTCPNGWYICNECSGCCSQEMLERRLNNLHTNMVFNLNNSRHKKLKIQVEARAGHFEKEQKFDYRTGVPI